MTKTELRSEMRVRLKTDFGRAEKSRAIAAAIAADAAFGKAGAVALFDSLPGEPDVASLWDVARVSGSVRQFCFPRVAGDEIVFYEVREPAELLAASWHAHIREPAHDDSRVIEPGAIGLVLVPGLAFTRDGRRLGRGGGFYDRLLARLPPHVRKIGVCFELQIVLDLPLEPHDRCVDAVVTESPADELRLPDFSRSS